jgi:hypothetical protein
LNAGHHVAQPLLAVSNLGEWRGAAKKLPKSRSQEWLCYKIKIKTRRIKNEHQQTTGRY